MSSSTIAITLLVNCIWCRNYLYTLGRCLYYRFFTDELIPKKFLRLTVLFFSSSIFWVKWLKEKFQRVFIFNARNSPRYNDQVRMANASQAFKDHPRIQVVANLYLKRENTHGNYFESVPGRYA